MGTNFYRRGKLTAEDKERFTKAVKEEDYKVIDELANKCSEVHIGKASMGWKFLWDAQYFNHFNPNKESIIEWLKSGLIFDEYGDQYTYEEFANYLYERNTPENQWDASTYSSYCTNEGKYSSFYPRDTRFFDWFRDRFRLDVDLYGEFYIDNLRFTVDSNFL